MDETMTTTDTKTWGELLEQLKTLNEDQLNRQIKVVDTLSFGQSYLVRQLKVSDGEILSKNDPYLTF
tara:strand:+ start:804 stop:1004 length:201 start_codon:yes stop_codon:yes gene_type:complete